MQINSVKTYNYNRNNYTNKKTFEAKNVVAPKPVSIKKDNKKSKKVILLSSIAGALLLAFIFRKNIKNLFKNSKKTIEPPITPSEPVKPPVESEKPEIDGQKMLEEYRTIITSQKPFPSSGSSEERAAWNKIDERRMELRRELRTNNISIVLKKDFPENPYENIQEKIEYLRGLRTDSLFNMSSQMDVIGEYAKYGVRSWINEETGESFIRNLFTVCSPLKTDSTEEHKKTVAEKFIEIAERTTERDNAGMRDSLKVIGIMEDYSKVLDEDLALRYIELLKKISFQQIDEYAVSSAVNHLLGKAKIQQALQEYHDILKKYPVEDFAGGD